LNLLAISGASALPAHLPATQPPPVFASTPAGSRVSPPVGGPRPGSGQDAPPTPQHPPRRCRRPPASACRSPPQVTAAVPGTPPRPCRSGPVYPGAPLVPCKPRQPQGNRPGGRASAAHAGGLSRCRRRAVPGSCVAHLAPHSTKEKRRKENPLVEPAAPAPPDNWHVLGCAPAAGPRRPQVKKNGGAPGGEPLHSPAPPRTVGIPLSWE